VRQRCRGLNPAVEERDPTSQVTELATARLTGTDKITGELIEADQTPAVVIVRWPSKPTVLHPQRFPSAADTTGRTFATAAVRPGSDQAGASAVSTVRRMGCGGYAQTRPRTRPPLIARPHH